MPKDKYIKLTRCVYGNDEIEHETGSDVVQGEDLKKALQDFICKSFNLDPNEDDDDLYKSVVLDVMDKAYKNGEELVADCCDMDAAGTSGIFIAKFIEVDFEEAILLLREQIDSAPPEWHVWLALECGLLKDDILKSEVKSENLFVIDKPLAKWLNENEIIPQVSRGVVSLNVNDENDSDVTARMPGKGFMDEHPEGADRGGYDPYWELPDGQKAHFHEEWQEA